MLHGLDMNGEVIASRIDVVLKTGFGVLDHQVCVEHRIGPEGLAEASDDGGAKC